MSTLLTAYATLTGTAIGISLACDSTLTDKSRRVIFDWLFEDRNCRRFRNWPSKALIIFRDLFGRQHFSRRCILSSLVLTTTFLSIFYFFAFFTNDGVFSNFLDTFILKSDVQNDYVILTIVIFFFVTLFTAAIPDYFSILETRCMLRIAYGSKKRIYLIAILIFFDAILTFLIFALITFVFLSISLAIKITYSMYYYENIDIFYLLLNMNRILEFSFSSYFKIKIDDIIRILSYEIWLTDFEPRPFFYFEGTKEKTLDIWLSQDRFSMISPLFYSTFMTSFWLWLFIAASAVSRASKKYSKLLQKIPRISDFLEYKPITIACLIPIIATLPIILIIEAII